MGLPCLSLRVKERSSFSFNPVTKKVVVEVNNEWKKEYVEYDVLGLVASFDLTEYEIK